MTADEVRDLVASGGEQYARELLQLWEAQHGRAAADPLWHAWLDAARREWLLADDGGVKHF